MNGMRLGRVQFGGIIRSVPLDFVPEAVMGDYVMVHVGFAISRVAAEEADRTYKLLAEMGAIEEELAIENAPDGNRALDWQDLRNDAPIAEMSQRFHNGLVQAFAQISERIRDETSLNRVCLSGGAFNNVYLSNSLESHLCSAGFEVFTQNEVPAGDGGLSLGQAMIAAHRTQSHGPPDLHVKHCALL